MKEKTLSIIKPDGIKARLTGRILTRIEEAGLQVKAMKMIRLTKEEAKGFYMVHQDKPFYGPLTDFMSEGPVLAMVLEGESAIQLLREIMGKTNPKEAGPGTIRRDFAESLERNVIHGSDSPSSALYEIGYFFNALEIMP
jgi:nucleoside-diphosphate kinase